MAGWLGPFEFPSFFTRMQQLFSFEWFYDVSKKTAAQALAAKTTPGWFLVRFSETGFGNYAVSKIAKKEVAHHTILHKSNGKYPFEF